MSEPAASGSEDDMPLSPSLKESSSKARSKPEDDDDDYEASPVKKKKKEKKSEKVTIKEEVTTTSKTGKKDETTVTRKRKVEVEEEVWKWWEGKKELEMKWRSLSHKGPVFAPPYEPLPDHIKFKYNGQVMKLSEPAEEVASLYARMLDHEYTSKDAFNTNFFEDWRKMMTTREKEIITDLKKCDFRVMNVYFAEQSEKRKAMSKEEKQKIKEIKEREDKEYGFACIDGNEQKIGNFRIEPPGLFRGRGDHPKMGRLKRRVMPEDVIINCSKDSEAPVPPPGHHWREVRHDNTVTWLCSWTENVLGQNKYILLNPSSKIKGEKDYEKFETALV